MRILLIDDSADATEMLAMLLETQGHHVLVAFTGLSGLALADASDPEVVIVDLGLPDIDGFDVIERLCSNRGGNNRAIVALTGRDDLESRRRALEGGASSYFVKGEDIGKLLALTKQPPQT